MSEQWTDERIAAKAEKVSLYWNEKETTRAIAEAMRELRDEMQAEIATLRQTLEIERLRSASDPKTGDERMTELEQKYLGKTVQMTGEVVDVVEPNSDPEVIGVKVGKTVEYVMPQSVEVVEWKQAEGISYIWYAQETNIKCPCGEEVFMDSDPAVCDGCGREYRVCHYVVMKMGSEEK